MEGIFEIFSIFIHVWKNSFETSDRKIVFQLIFSLYKE